MKTLLIIAVMLTLFIGGCLVWRSVQSRYCFTGPARHYANLEALTNSGIVSWIPDCLPPSAYEIREKCHYDNNRAIAAFRFSPSENMSRYLQSGERLSLGTLASNPPPLIGSREPWFPAALHKGNYQEFLDSGFTFYGLRQRSGMSQCEWALALNTNSGRAYLWLFEGEGTGR